MMPLEITCLILLASALITLLKLYDFWQEIKRLRKGLKEWREIALRLTAEKGEQ